MKAAGINLKANKRYIAIFYSIILLWHKIVQNDGILDQQITATHQGMFTDLFDICNFSLSVPYYATLSSTHHLPRRNNKGVKAAGIEHKTALNSHVKIPSDTQQNLLQVMIHLSEKIYVKIVTGARTPYFTDCYFTNAPIPNNSNMMIPI